MASFLSIVVLFRLLMSELDKLKRVKTLFDALFMSSDLIAINLEMQKACHLCSLFYQFTIHNTGHVYVVSPFISVSKWKNFQS